MRVSILLQITADDGTAGTVEEVVAFEKATEQVGPWQGFVRDPHTRAFDAGAELGGRA